MNGILAHWLYKQYALISRLLKQSLLFGTDEHSWDSLMIIYSCVYLIDNLTCCGSEVINMIE